MSCVSYSKRHKRVRNLCHELDIATRRSSHICKQTLLPTYSLSFRTPTYRWLKAYYVRKKKNERKKKKEMTENKEWLMYATSITLLRIRTRSMEMPSYHSRCFLSINTSSLLLVFVHFRYIYVYTTCSECMCIDTYTML